MKTLICIPTYNEAENIEPLVRDVLAATAGTGAGVGATEVHVLVADDNSPDGTGKIVDRLVAESGGRVFALHRERKAGLGQAYVAAFRWGLERGYDRLIEMDADFSHHPRYLPTMLSTLDAADVAIGSRNIAGGGTVNWGIGRKILSRGGSLYARIILGAPIHDFTGGFNGWRREVIEAVDLASLRSDGYSFQIELKYRAFRRGYRIREFPIVFEDRKVGASKMHRRIVLEALKRVWEFRFRAMKNDLTLPSDSSSAAPTSSGSRR